MVKFICLQDSKAKQRLDHLVLEATGSQVGSRQRSTKSSGIATSKNGKLSMLNQKVTE